MAAKKLTNTRRLLSLVDKLICSGYSSEKAIMDMTIDQILRLDELSLDEMRRITELQKAIKNHSVIAFLAGGDESGQQNN